METEDHDGRDTRAPAATSSPPARQGRVAGPGTTTGGSTRAPEQHRAGVAVAVAATEAPDPDLPVLSAATELSRQVRRRPRTLFERRRGLVVAAWLVGVAAGLACLVLALLGVGPTYLGDVGAVAVLATYSLALAARVGGRPIVFGAVALVAGTGVLLSGQPYLRTGAAVMMCAIAATLAVVVTVPRLRFVRVVQECVLAVVIASIGALATLGFAPTISLVRFEYVALALALLATFAVVFRLGAGLHGLGRRGVVVVLIGAAVLVVTLLYAEALRRYGPPGLVDALLDSVRWSRERLGAFPRPVEAVLGIPALAWGVQMRARRRQGWWVCAFGAAGTVAVANSLLNPALTIREDALSVLYGLVVGLVFGYAAIRVDLALARTGSGGRRSQEHAAARPEPPRTSSLL